VAEQHPLLSGLCDATVARAEVTAARRGWGDVAREAAHGDRVRLSASAVFWLEAVDGDFVCHVAIDAPDAEILPPLFACGEVDLAIPARLVDPTRTARALPHQSESGVRFVPTPEMETSHVANVARLAASASQEAPPESPRHESATTDQACRVLVVLGGGHAVTWRAFPRDTPRIVDDHESDGVARLDEQDRHKTAVAVALSCWRFDEWFVVAPERTRRVAEVVLVQLFHARGAVGAGRVVLPRDVCKCIAEFVVHPAALRPPVAPLWWSPTDDVP
jgi:hypothetical protein